jgi:hypothetical protein
VKYHFNMKGDFQALMASFGLANTTESKVPVTVPLSFSVGTAGSYGTTQAFTYKATAGKSGTASSS